MSFEYLIVEVHSWDDGTDNVNLQFQGKPGVITHADWNRGKLCDVLNQLGGVGWELVVATDKPASRSTRLAGATIATEWIFKREKERR
jgi:hypothetical protein